MNDLKNTNELLEIVGQVLIRCFTMGICVLLFWFGALTLAGDLTYSVHAKLVPISQQQFNVVHYTGMLMTKATVFFLFLLPYIAIKLVIKKQGR